MANSVEIPILYGAYESDSEDENPQQQINMYFKPGQGLDRKALIGTPGTVEYTDYA